MLNWPCSNVPLLISFCEKWRAKVMNIPYKTRIINQKLDRKQCQAGSIRSSGQVNVSCPKDKNKAAKDGALRLKKVHFIYSLIHPGSPGFGVSGLDCFAFHR